MGEEPLPVSYSEWPAFPSGNPGLSGVFLGATQTTFPEPGSANSPTPGHQRADAESVGCLHSLELRGQGAKFKLMSEMSSWDVD